MYGVILPHLSFVRNKSEDPCFGHRRTEYNRFSATLTPKGARNTLTHFRDMCAKRALPASQILNLSARCSTNGLLLRSKVNHLLPRRDKISSVRINNNNLFFFCRFSKMKLFVVSFVSLKMRRRAKKTASLRYN